MSSRSFRIRPPTSTSRRSNEVLVTPDSLGCLAVGAVGNKLARRIGAALIAPIVLFVPACSSGAKGNTAQGPGRGSCSSEVRERLDPGSLRHVLPGGAPQKYLSDPPTSGAHQPGTNFSGVVGKPIYAPQQLAVLEGGQILIQYRDISETERLTINGFAGKNVVVAPNPTMPNKIILTAWRTKVTCDRPEDAPIREFVGKFATGIPPALLDP